MTPRRIRDALTRKTAAPPAEEATDVGSAEASTPWQAVLEELPRPLLVLTGDLPRRAQRYLHGLEDAVVVDLASAWSGESEFRSVALLVRDASEMRRAASVLPTTGRASHVVGVLLSAFGRSLTLSPRPSWPKLVQLTCWLRHHALAHAEFGHPVAAQDVLVEMARSLTPDRMRTNPRQALGVARADRALWPVAEPGALVLDEIPLDAAERAAVPDLTVSSADLEAATPWSPAAEQMAGRGVGRAVVSGSDLDPLDLGPMDDMLLNPVGFQRRASGGVATLTDRDGTLLLTRGELEVRVGTHGGTRDRHVQVVRPAQWLTLDWRTDRSPEAYSRIVAGLAMTGTPLVADHEPPTWAKELLGTELVDLTRAATDLTDPLVREEHSIAQRRLALSSFGAPAWRDRLAERSGVGVASRSPQATVLLASRRPALVRSAIRQMQRQRNVELEILVATHGFELDQPGLRNAAATQPHRVEVVPFGPEVPFGEVLDALAHRAASGNLLKVDDDDWYGPHFVEDLLLAQRYSGAEVVGTAAELCWIEPLDVTLRRSSRTESYRPTVAGGTILVDSGTYRAVGGFRPHRKHVDAGLLRAVRSGGGAVYRSHGLGYLLRRTSSGHTWDIGVEHFLQEHKLVQRWDGFRPTATLDVPHDLRPGA